MENLIRELLHGSTNLGVFKVYLFVGCVELLTGYLANIYAGKNLQESVNREEVIRHISIFLTTWGGLALSYIPEIPPIIDDVVGFMIAFFVITYGFDILDNFSKMGVNIPKFLLKDKEDNYNERE